MTFTISCPNCRQSLAAPLGHGGRYVTCGACQASFLVIDEETLPAGEVVEFRPGAGEAGARRPSTLKSGASLRTPVAIHHLDSALSAGESDDSLKPLATVSVFLGGVSLSLVFIPPLAIVSSVAGTALGIVSLRTTSQSRAVLGMILNIIALISAAALWVEKLQDLPGG